MNIKPTPAVIAVLAIALFGLHGRAQAADQIDQLFPSASQGCVDGVKVNLVEAIRAGIDKEVKRHEAALQKPPSLDSMGCLDNLFNVNLDFAIQVPDLTKLFQGAVSDAEQQICTYAQDAWNKVTEPLQANLQLPSFGKLELPGGGGGGDVPSLDFNYDDGGSLNMAAPADPNTGRRRNDGTLLNDLYNSLYGPGGN